LEKLTKLPEDVLEAVSAVDRRHLKVSTSESTSQLSSAEAEDDRLTDDENERELTLHYGYLWLFCTVEIHTSIIQ